MARANAQGPDTLLQACLRPTRTNPLADRGRAMHSVHTTHSGVLSQSPTREQPHPARLRAGRRAVRHSIAKMDGTRKSKSQGTHANCRCSTHAVRSHNQTDFAGGSGHAEGEFAPSAQPSRCSSSQISPGPRTHATSASGVEARQRHRSLLRAPRRKSHPIRRRSAEHDDQSAIGRSGRT